MKSTLPLRCIVAAAVSLLSGKVIAQDGGLKTASVSLVQLVQEFHKTKALKDQVKIESERISSEANKKTEKVREMETELAKLKEEMDSPSLADERRKKIFDDHQIKFQQAVQMDNARMELYYRRMRALNEKNRIRLGVIAKEIQEIVAKHAKAENYDMVFDKTADSSNGGLPVMIFAKDATDITGTLLDEINKNAPASTATTIDTEDEPANE